MPVTIDEAFTWFGKECQCDNYCTCEYWWKHPPSTPNRCSTCCGEPYYAYVGGRDGASYWCATPPTEGTSQTDATHTLSTLASGAAKTTLKAQIDAAAAISSGSKLLDHCPSPVRDYDHLTESDKLQQQTESKEACQAYSNCVSLCSKDDQCAHDATAKQDCVHACTTGNVDSSLKNPTMEKVRKDHLDVNQDIKDKMYSRCLSVSNPYNGGGSGQWELNHDKQTFDSGQTPCIKLVHKYGADVSYNPNFFNEANADLHKRNCVHSSLTEEENMIKCGYLNTRMYNQMHCNRVGCFHRVANGSTDETSDCATLRQMYDNYETKCLWYENEKVHPSPRGTTDPVSAVYLDPDMSKDELENASPSSQGYLCAGQNEKAVFLKPDQDPDTGSTASWEVCKDKCLARVSQNESGCCFHRPANIYTPYSWYFNPGAG